MPLFPITHVLDGQHANTAFGREEPMIVFLAVGRSKTFYEVVRSESLATFHTAKALGMPDSVQQIVTVLERRRNRLRTTLKI